MRTRKSDILSIPKVTHNNNGLYINGLSLNSIGDQHSLVQSIFDDVPSASDENAKTRHSATIRLNLNFIIG